MTTGLGLLATPAQWAPDNTVAVIVAVVAAVGSVIGGVVAARASVRANRITAEAQERAAERKVDSEAFARAQQIYDHAIDELREELARIRALYDAERATSQEVRRQLEDAQREMAQMRERLALMERVIDRLRKQILTAGLVPEVSADGQVNGGGQP